VHIRLWRPSGILPSFGWRGRRIGCHIYIIPYATLPVNVNRNFFCGRGDFVGGEGGLAPFFPSKTAPERRQIAKLRRGAVKAPYNRGTYTGFGFNNETPETVNCFINKRPIPQNTYLRPYFALARFLQCNFVVRKRGSLKMAGFVWR